jgi:hypothetical protein
MEISRIIRDLSIEKAHFMYEWAEFQDKMNNKDPNHLLKNNEYIKRLYEFNRNIDDASEILSRILTRKSF